MSLEGQQLGRYHFQRLLGSGGMGEVYLATDTLINRQVAVKVIRAEAASYPNAQASQEAARLFQREMKAISQLDHPHILPLFDYGEENLSGSKLAYLVMPFRGEGSLATWLQEHGSADLLSPQQVEHIVSQAAEALQHAHNRQIIHQDVKPANFLIRNREAHPQQPDLLLADFGVAKLSSATTNASQSVRGTPTYMAPEQWSGQPVPASDQYALAVMAYELLTGRPPFQGPLMQVMYQHTRTPPPPPSTLNSRLSKDVDTVLLHALAKKPEERFASITAFARALQQALPGVEATSQTKLSTEMPTIVKTQNTPGKSGIPIQEPTIPTSNTQLTSQPTIPVASSENMPVFSAEGTNRETRASTFDSLRDGKLTVNRRPTRARTPLLIGLVLLVIAAGFGAFYVLNTHQPSVSSSNTHQSSPTPNATTPAPAGVNAQATATITALQNQYAQLTSGTPALDDPLSDNSKGYGWREGSKGVYACTFQSPGGGNYHVIQQEVGFTEPCPASNTHFSNFVYQARMTIFSGDEGGIVFRYDDALGRFYYFHIDANGNYGIDSFNFADSPKGTPLKSGSSSTIQAGTGNPNLLTAVVMGNHIDLYINQQYVDTVIDSSYSTGEIGVAATDSGNNTDVAFSDARVWTL